MEYISTTELRTKAKKLRDALARGEETYLVHRSKVIGVISPPEDKKEKPIVATAEKLKALAEALPPTGKNYSYEERDAIKREYLEGKYGKPVS